MGTAFLSIETTGIAFVAVVWIASVSWTGHDSARRCSNSSFAVASVLVALLLPIVGAALYALIRPCEERLDVRARRLRIRMLEAALADPQERCPACAVMLEPEYRSCPGCGLRVRHECDGCGSLVHTAWATCPWCTKPVSTEGRLPEVA